MLFLTTVPMTHQLFAQARWDDRKWVHHRVMELFGPLNGASSEARQAANVLFRVEPDIADGRVLVQSSEAPNVDGVRTRPLGPLLTSFVSDGKVQFLVHANAVKTVNRTRDDGTEKTCRVPVPADDLRSWLENKLVDAINVDSLTTNQTQWERQGRNGLLFIAQFRGAGKVVDPQVLTSTIRDGVGRAKAFGCGLLSALPQD